MLFGKILNKILNRYWRYKYSRVKLIKTLIMNLRCFPLKDAIKFPVYIYGDTEIQEVGTFLIYGSVTRGMIRIGLKSIKAAGKTKLRGKGTYIFHGQAQFWGGCIFENWGTIELGQKVAFAEGCKVMCKERIVLEDYVHFGFNCTLMDTDFHYVVNLEDYSVRRNTAPIIVEEGTWVASDCKLMKGSHIPPNSVVTGGCLINKDYSKEAPCQIYIGVPGKPRKSGYRRIYNVLAQYDIDDYFRNHPEDEVLKLDIAGDIDGYCCENCLNFYEVSK